MTKMTVVGVGALGRHHARILNEMDGVELVAVCDPNEAQGQTVAEAQGVPWIADYREILGNVDAVSIVVPTFLHRQVALDCLDAGCNILVEKPIAGTLSDGEAIVSTAKRAGKVLAVGHVERCNPAFVALQNECSNPLYIRAERSSPYAFRSTDVSVVHDMLIHDIDLVLALTGAEVERVEAFGLCLAGGNFDQATARLHLSTGCLVDLVANRMAASVTRSMQVITEKGTLTADFQSREVQCFEAGTRVAAGELPLECAQAGETVEDLKPQLLTEFYQTRSIPVIEQDALTAELDAFVQATRSETLRPFATGEDGFKALQVADRICEAVLAHQWNNELTGPNVWLPNVSQNKAAA